MGEPRDETEIHPSPVETSSSQATQPTLEPVAEVSSALCQSHPSNCTICRQIMRCFLVPFDEEHEINLGPAEAALSVECSAHTPLLAGLKERYESSDYTTISLQESEFRLWKPIASRGLNITMTTDKFGGGLAVGDLQLVKPTSFPGHAGSGLILDSQWIDPTILINWKECCLQSHGRVCANPPRQDYVSQSTPSWLVDVQSRCLIPGKPEMDYVALSYVWGRRKV